MINRVAEEKLAKLSDAKYNEGQKKNLENEISSYDKRISEAEDIRKEEGNRCYYFIWFDVYDYTT